MQLANITGSRYNSVITFNVLVTVGQWTLSELELRTVTVAEMDFHGKRQHGEVARRCNDDGW